MGNFHKISLSGLCIGLVFDILAVVTPGWIYVQDAFARGLFYGVNDGHAGKVTMWTADKLALSFLCTGGAILIAAIVCSIRNLKENRKDFKIMGGFLGIIAGLFMITGMSSYTGLYSDYVQPTRVSWGYSYVFGWISAWICLISGCIGIFGMVKSYLMSI
uniref:uncharacterized protein LOC120341547 n=1 Tax=Styela clava TaxID=7725 RepID=UPI00193AC303|nr:uncharacterized protein LOC120341547 [Styela clava]